MAVESGQNATWRPKKSARVKRFSEDDKLAQTLEKLSFSCPVGDPLTILATFANFAAVTERSLA